MATKSLGNPFDADTSLTHTNDCSCRLCQAESVNPGGLTDDQRLVLLEQQAEQGEGHSQSTAAGELSFNSSEDLLDRAVESAIVRGVFGHNDTSRRNFIRLMGGGTLATVLGSMIPL
jgi:nitrate/nitrite transport system substrate-binding protein